MILSKTAGAFKTHTQTRAWPYMVIFFGFFIGATGPIFIRLALSEHIHSLVITAYRQIFSVMILTPLVLTRHRHELRLLAPRDLVFAALAGIILATRFYLMFEAFNNTSVLITGVLNGSGPLWVALAEVAFLKATLNRNIWLGLGLTLLGGLVIGLAGFDSGSALGSNPAMGVAFALTSAFLSAFYLNIGRAIRGRMSFWPYLWLVFLFAAITSVLASLAAGLPLTGYSPKGYLWLILLTIMAQLVGHGAINYALGYISATFVSISGQLGNVISVILAFLIFSELPGPFHIIGGIIITAGVIIATLGKSARKQAELTKNPTS